MMQQNSAAALSPSSRRPVPLCQREDLVIRDILYRGVAYPVVKDPLALKYYRLQPEQAAVLRFLDGKRSLQAIRDDLQASFPTTHITPTEVQSLIVDLHEKGLLTSHRPGQGETALKRRQESWLRELQQTVMNPLFLRLPGWDPDRFLTRMKPWLGWIFSPPGIVGFLLLIAASWLFVAIRFDDVRRKLPEFQQFFGWPNLMYLWLVMAVTKVVHEFGHGLACKYYGGDCHSMGVVVMVFSPTLYCDVTDSWMMKNKWRRMMIGAAGMYVEMILAALAIFFWYQSQTGVLQHLALNVFFISALTTIVFNANPLLRYDGYYILSDYLEIPNLQPQASKMLQQSFARHVLGIEVPEDPFLPKTGQGWFITFLVASWIYRWVVLFGITLFLYTVLKPYRLQSLGIVAATGSVVAVIGGIFWSLFSMLKTPRRDPLSRVKIFLAILAVAALVGGGLSIPVPWYEEAAFYIEPVGMQHIYATVPGTVEELFAAEGKDAEAGFLLMRLASPELIDKRDDLLEQISAQQVEPKLYRELRDPEGEHLALQRLQSLNGQLADVNSQLERLNVTSPVAGRVIAPSRIPGEKHDFTQPRLPGWHGTPLDIENLGMTVEAGTHLCSIAPEDCFEAVMLIGQADRGDLQLGDQVRLKLELFPGQVWTGRVSEYSNRQLDFAPAALSQKHGGPLPTVTESQGRERLTSAVYQAHVQFDGPADLLRTGMRGTARFVVAKRTLFD
jgi:putative peptide zinc metalloprotease protein